MLVISIDPGMHTGYMMVDVQPADRTGVVLECRTLEGHWGAHGVREDPEYGYWPMVCELFKKVEQVDVLVLEDFILMPSVHGGTGVVDARREALSAVRVTSLLLGALGMSLKWEGVIVRQQLSAKKPWNQNRLRSMGLWQVGATTHQRDAAKHMAHWAKSHGIAEFVWQ